MTPQMYWILISYLIGLVSVATVVIYHFLWKPIAVEIHRIGRKTVMREVAVEGDKDKKQQKETQIYELETNNLPPILYDRAYKDKKNKGSGDLWLAKAKVGIPAFHTHRRSYEFFLLKVIKERLILWTDDMDAFHPVDFTLLSDTSKIGYKPIATNARQFYVNRKNAILAKKMGLKMNPTIFLAGVFVFGAIMMIILQNQMGKNFIEMADPFFKAARDLNEAAGSLKNVAGGLPGGFEEAVPK